MDVCEVAHVCVVADVCEVARKIGNKARTPKNDRPSKRLSVKSGMPVQSEMSVILWMSVKSRITMTSWTSVKSRMSVNSRMFVRSQISVKSWMIVKSRVFVESRMLFIMERRSDDKCFYCLVCSLRHDMLLLPTVTKNPKSVHFQLARRWPPTKYWTRLLPRLNSKKPLLQWTVTVVRVPGISES